MAKRIRAYKGFVIKENTHLEEGDYKYWVCTYAGDIEWECDSMQEAYDWIDSYEGNKRGGF